MAKSRSYRIAERQAKRYFGSHRDRMIFLRQMGAEAHFQDLRSPAGAQGPAQLMPGTARSWGVRNPHDPNQAFSAAAKHMADYLRAYHGSWAKALTAYNAGPGAVGRALPGETRAYIRNILGGRGDAQAAAGGLGGAAGDYSPDRLQLGMKDVFDKRAFEAARGAAVVGQLLAKRHGTHGVLFKTGVLRTDMPTREEFTKGVLTSGIERGRGSGGGGGGSVVRGHTSVRLAPGADRSGVHTSRYLRRVLSGVVGIPGGITITTGSNHNRLTVNGNVSDHWTGHAADIAVPVDSKRGDLIAGRVLMRLGVPRAKARAMARQGGLFTVEYGGHRWQVIWKTNEGGNHHNHVHVGVQ